MHRVSEMRVAVTGAAGLIERAVVDRIERGALGSVGDLRLNDVRAFTHAHANVVVGSYAHPSIRKKLIGKGVDILIHLASLPGGASARDPALGKSVNLDGSIALFDCACGTSCPVIVYTSSIAALVSPLKSGSEEPALRPSSSYGTHKAMVELYLTDLTRRGLVDGRTVRPAGIVARPRTAYQGFTTAWMSELFHAALEGNKLSIPVRADSQIWLQSIGAVADNIIHAALMQLGQSTSSRSWTLPATMVRADALVASLRRHTGQALSVEYAEAPGTQATLDFRAALALGFVSDGDTDALVNSVMGRLGSG